MVTIGRAEPADAKALAEVYNKSFYSDFIKYGACPGYGKTERDMLEGMQTRFVYKIVVRGNIVGAISVKQKKDDCYYLGTLCVVPEYANQGIGQAAMRLLDEEFPDATHWALKTPADKLQNHYFYKKLGYAVTKEYMDGTVKVAYFERTRTAT